MHSVYGIPGQMVAILRQELDSLVRVVYLLEQTDRSYRKLLIEKSVAGQRWLRPNSRSHVTDRDMVDLTNTLHGWTKSVYDFGCAFIHLSSFHDYQVRDPLAQITVEERRAILTHMHNYHHAPNETETRFIDIVPYLPMVFEKIAANLECYVKQLEEECTPGE